MVDKNSHYTANRLSKNNCEPAGSKAHAARGGGTSTFRVLSRKGVVFNAANLQSSPLPSKKASKSIRTLIGPFRYLL